MATSTHSVNRFGPQRKRRIGLVVAVAIVIFSVFLARNPTSDQADITTLQGVFANNGVLATDVLALLEVKGRAPATGYSRDKFGNGWASVAGCDMRNRILARDLTDEILRDDNCVVISGVLDDPYTGQKIQFTRGNTTSDDVQIDHVVALSDAWQKGAQLLSEDERIEFSNDPLNLLAVDGPTNVAKGNSDAASWLPPNRDYRCRYVARQIAVKQKYRLWVTSAEKTSMTRVLERCPNQMLPIKSSTE